MLQNPLELADNLGRLEEIEKASLRLVVQAVYDYRLVAATIFKAEADLAADIGEDMTREALDKMGVSRIEKRLFGKIDYKRARYLFHPDFAMKQALFVDSKAEKNDGRGTATLQTSQVSLSIRLRMGTQSVDVAGDLPTVLSIDGERYIVTTIFVKYNYVELADGQKVLKDIIVAALPNGYLQDIYNPTAENSIWKVGRHAPSRGEAFRVRLSFASLRAKAGWRVQKIPIGTDMFIWNE